MKYEDLESEFLESIASKYGFDGNTRTTFLLRFKEKDAEMINKTLSSQYEAELTLNTRERRGYNNDKEPDAEAILRDRLKVICDRFAQAGCEYNPKTRNKWKIAKAWLRETEFPEWVKQQQELDNPVGLWQQLWNKVTSDKGIKVKDISKLKTLPIDPIAWGGKKETIPKFSSRYSKLIYEIAIERSGYLILIQKSSDTIYCFSPSFLVKGFYHHAGIHDFPYINNPCQLTHIPLEEGRSGIEEIIAIVSYNEPNFAWLPLETEQPLKLDKNYLADLLYFLDIEKELLIMNTKYLVVA